MRDLAAFAFTLVLVSSTVRAVPLVLKESSPSGEAIVAISSSDPDIKKYINFAFPNDPTNQQAVISSGNADSNINTDNPNFVGRSFSFVSPGAAAAGDGRSFVSTSSFNPFLLPFFFSPINYEGLGLNNNMGLLNNNWFKGAEGFYDPSFAGNGEGEVQTVSAVNDNGHIYGNVKTVTFDNRPKTSN